MGDYSDVCTHYLEDIFEQFDYAPIKGCDLEHTILRTLIGTLRTTRLGSMPTKETSEEILHRIRQKIKQNQPLEVTSAWGAIKTIPTASRGVDLAELLTLKQFQAISNAIKKIYSPGIKFNLFLGDSYYSYLYGKEQAIENYCDEMKILTKDYEGINAVCLSELGGNSNQFLQQCQNNYELLRRYWFETAELPLELYTSTDAFHKLKAAGWVGTITPAMREFYFKRMNTLYPKETIEFKIDKVLHFFAYGLMISQNDLMGRKSWETSTIDACLLRVPPPDLPRKLYSNRLRMRIAPESISKLSAPPWTVAGTICVNSDNDLRIRFFDVNSYKMLELEDVKYKNMTLSIYKSKANCV